MRIMTGIVPSPLVLRPRNLSLSKGSHCRDLRSAFPLLPCSCAPAHPELVEGSLLIARHSSLPFRPHSTYGLSSLKASVTRQ